MEVQFRIGPATYVSELTSTAEGYPIWVHRVARSESDNRVIERHAVSCDCEACFWADAASIREEREAAYREAIEERDFAPNRPCPDCLSVQYGECETCGLNA